MTSINQKEGTQGVWIEIPADVFEKSADFAEIVQKIQAVTMQQLAKWLGEELTALDQRIRKEKKQKGWHADQYREKTVVTSIGDVTYFRTTYRNREEHATDTPLDRILHIDAHAHLSEDAKAAILEEVYTNSYDYSGAHIGGNSIVSKEAVKELLHSLTFPREQDRAEAAEKRNVKYLYIEADEDHAANQIADEDGNKDSIITKMVYTHEGKYREPCTRKKDQEYRKKRILKNTHYFSGVYEGDANRVLWDEVYAYVTKNYDMKEIQYIFLNSDCGTWIRQAKEVFPKIIQVMDEFHLEKYLHQITGFYPEEDRKNTKAVLRELIRADDREGFERAFEAIRKDAEEAGVLTANRKEVLEKTLVYFSNNWESARRRLMRIKGIVGSSTEGHVYQVLSRRMSTQAMAWSAEGADAMAKLRAYKLNHGDMLELVRFQRTEMKGKKVVGDGDEELYVGLTLREILRSEKPRHGELGRNYEIYHHDVADSVRQAEWFKGLVIGGRKI